MIQHLKRMGVIAITAVALCSSCNQQTKSAQETTEIKTMDSTSTQVEEQTEKLKEQTKKVEESLEKLDKEFESDK